MNLKDLIKMLLGNSFYLPFLLFSIQPLQAQNNDNIQNHLSNFLGVSSFKGGAQSVQKHINQFGNCHAIAPTNWQITGTRREGDALDIISSDGKLAVGYLITGVQGNLTTGYYSYQYANPETYLSFILSENGTKNVSYGQVFQDHLGYMILPFEINQSPPVKGVVFYRVWSIPGDPYGYIISMRLAKGLESVWKTHGNQAIAVALSIRCNKQLIVQDNSSSQNTTDKRVESEYNMQLGMEYAHDPVTGE
ncbi:MAG: hypothetical protein Q7V19_07930, partial [Bacteroidales bacterium]|nr:hypothetical protein [Bacteroidales bacterium]